MRGILILVKIKRLQVKLKNFYITDDLNASLKAARKILDKSEGEIVREILTKYLRRFFPASITSQTSGAKKLLVYVFKKYKNKCSICDAQISLSSKKRKLEIHHRDFDPKNNIISNLILVCRTCHGKVYHSGSNYHRNRKVLR
uniref:Putative homing endonuclease n=1 Tax=viral metagenome TaxID=1070528 RepID=A0A6M3KRZ9_9ZZZZ